MPNVNPKTGIAYGVVSLNSLQDWVFDEFVVHGKNLTAIRAEEEVRAENPKSDEWEIDEILACMQLEEEEYEFETHCGMKLLLSYLGGAPLVWVLESPHTTMCAPCSPCVPGAGDLDNQHTDGVEAYTLPPDWFSDM